MDLRRCYTLMRILRDGEQTKRMSRCGYRIDIFKYDAIVSQLDPDLRFIYKMFIRMYIDNKLYFYIRRDLLKLNKSLIEKAVKEGVLIEIEKDNVKYIALNPEKAPW
ncbi:MAG: hypothetical protein DRJ49_00525 [Thermoprotei archaeon]|nr:MAG: hypothetical protein DRJ49_00525 [Thermoprotei archaeon]